MSHLIKIRDQVIVLYTCLSLNVSASKWQVQFFKKQPPQVNIEVPDAIVHFPYSSIMDAGKGADKESQGVEE